MKEPKTTETTARTNKAEDVLILPGCLFFIETVEVPNSLDANEVTDFVELSLESISPFPIDQLNWGYIHRQAAASLLLYAAHRDRLKNFGYDNLDEYAWVLPDFATVAGVHFTRDTLVALESKSSINLLHFKSNTPVPQSVRVDTLTTPVDEYTVKTLKSEIKNLPEGIRTLHLNNVTATLDENNLCVFKHSVIDQTGELTSEETLQIPTPTESQLWQADVRETDFKEAEYSKRRTSAWISRIVGWAAILALVLIGIEGVLLASEKWLKTKLSLIETQRSAVSKVEEKQILVNKLEQVSRNELRPIEMLEIANNLRLKLNLGIEYDSVIVEGENHITIEGKASSVNSFNRYTQNLKDSGYFELLATPEYLTRAGRTTFKVRLAYTPKISIEEDPTTNLDAPATNVSTSAEETKS